jgi:hypothetical protein
MSDTDRAAQLRQKMLELGDELREIENRPLTAAEAADLARTNPAEFNRRFDQALADGRPNFLTKEQ